MEVTCSGTIRCRLPQQWKADALVFGNCSSRGMCTEFILVLRK